MPSDRSPSSTPAAKPAPRQPSAGFSRLIASLTGPRTPAPWYANASEPAHEPARRPDLGDRAVGGAVPPAPAGSEDRRDRRTVRSADRALCRHLGPEARQPVRPASARGDLLARRRRRPPDDLSGPAGRTHRPRGT